MKKIIFLTATVALLIFAVSCNQTMTDEQFATMVKEIYYKLPESVMCDELKTDQQRRAATLNTTEDPNAVFSINHLSYYNYYGEGTLTQWDMANYLTDDGKNVVIIVRLRRAVHETYETTIDKTLNYNIKTKEITEIERPMDAFTTDELIVGTRFSNPQLAGIAKSFFNTHNRPLHYFDFNKNGFNVSADLLGYAPYDDPWDEQNRVMASYKWNGSRFVKGERWYLNEYNEKVLLGNTQPEATGDYESDETEDYGISNPAPPPPKAIVGKWKSPVKRRSVAYLEIYEDGMAELCLCGANGDERYEIYSGTVCPADDVDMDGDDVDYLIDMAFELNWYIYESEDGSPINIPDSYKGTYILRRYHENGKRMLYLQAIDTADPLFEKTEMRMEWVQGD